MTLSVGICFGKMTSLHEGLGEYGLLFGQHLARRADELRRAHGIELFYRLPDPLRGAFGDAVHHLPQRRLQRFLSVHARRFDLWHMLHQHDPFRPPLLARRCLVTVHDLNQLYDADQRFVAKSNRRIARIASWADSFVAISEHTRRDLQRLFGTSRPVNVVYNGVRDLGAVAQERPPGAPEPGFLLHLSRMSALKNVDSLLAMMRLLPQRRLVLAGPESGDSLRTRDKARAMGLSNVQFLFDVSVAGKAWLYANCRAFLFPSLAEGFGLPPVEAMQFGKPVLLSALTSLPEVGGEVAHYWPSFEPAAMRDRLEQVLAGWHEPGDSERVRAWARRFTWERCIDGYVAQYLSMLGLQTRPV